MKLQLFDWRGGRAVPGESLRRLNDAVITQIIRLQFRMDPVRDDRSHIGRTGPQDCEMEQNFGNHAGTFYTTAEWRRVTGSSGFSGPSC